MVVHQSGVTIKEAAQFLGISEAAVRQRLLRGTLTSTRQNGRVFVLLPEDTSSDTPDDTMAETSDTVADPINLLLVMQLRDEIIFLRGQVDIKDRQISELHVMLQTAQRLIPATVPDAPHAPERPADDETRMTSGTTADSAPRREPAVSQRPPQRSSWWSRLFGLE